MSRGVWRSITAASLAFTDVRTSKWSLFKRQLLSWNKHWPQDFTGDA